MNDEVNDYKYRQLISILNAKIYFIEYEEIIRLLHIIICSNHISAIDVEDATNEQ